MLIIMAIHATKFSIMGAIDNNTGLCPVIIIIWATLITKLKCKARGCQNQYNYVKTAMLLCAYHSVNAIPKKILVLL